MSEPIRFVYASDSHGDMADPEALAALTAALPEAYRARTADVAAQLAVARASQEFYSDANARVIAFLKASTHC